MADLVWTLKHPAATPEWLGRIPEFLKADDRRPAKEQFDERYVFGGWNPFSGFLMKAGSLDYPGDRPVRLLAETTLRGETIRLYECSWVAVVQEDGSYEISRMD